MAVIAQPKNSLSMLTSKKSPKYEVRAVWLATIGGIDWPSTYAHDGIGITSQQQQLCDMLDQLKEAHINTVLLQTRVRATTIFPSSMEPWDGCLSGTPGCSPGYDVLQFAIDECHRRGMELHAWVVTIPIGKWNSYGCKQLRRRYPSMVLRIGEEGYMNPESEQTADYLADFCTEVARCYDVDGIHLDYIRYPETWRGSKRTSYIDRIVERIYGSVKGLKPWVKLSCSPIGKSDDLARYSSHGWNAYRRVAQDAQGWLRRGLMDQLYPMMYFRDNQFYPFALDWQENACGRTVVAGLGTYMLSSAEGNWPLAEMKRQLCVSRQIGLGHCSFRAKFLLSNTKGIFNYTKTFDGSPALTPPMTWQRYMPPTPPTEVHIEHTTEGDNLSWHGATDRSNGSYLLYNVYASTDESVDISNPANLVAMRCQYQQLSIRREARKPQLYYAVTALDRYGNESAPAIPALIGKQESYHSEIISNDGYILAVPQRTMFDAPLLMVVDMQERTVLTCANQPTVYIGRLEDGIYQLRSINKKGWQHRLGYFVVKRKVR